MTAKFCIGDVVSYSGPTFPWLLGRGLTIVRVEPHPKAGYMYAVRPFGQTRGVRVFEKNLSSYRDQVPTRARPFAVGARVKTINNVLEGIIKELLEGSDVLVTMPSGVTTVINERHLVPSRVSTAAPSFLKKAPVSAGKQADIAATLQFVMNEERVQSAPPGLWADGKRVRAATPGSLRFTSTLHTKPVRVVVAALPGALRYVP